MMIKRILISAACLMALAVQAQAKTVTLKWTAPTTNENGTPLDDLAGYRVCKSGISIPDNRGTADCTHDVQAANPAPAPNTTVQTTLICSVSPCYFRVFAYDDEQPPNESVLSNQVTDVVTQLPDTEPPSAPMIVQTIGVTP